MELLVPHECHYCGLVDEAKFIFSGPHVKQVCNGCNRYVKFYSMSAIPDVREIKLKIWSLTTDLNIIDECKIKSSFVPGLSGIDNKITYWRLYLKVRERMYNDD